MLTTGQFPKLRKGQLLRYAQATTASKLAASPHWRCPRPYYTRPPMVETPAASTDPEGWRPRAEGGRRPSKGAGRLGTPQGPSVYFSIDGNNEAVLAFACLAAHRAL